MTHRSLAEGHDDPVAEALRTPGLDLDSLADDVLWVGKERCYGSGRSPAGIGLRAGEKRHSCSGTAHRNHRKGVGKGSIALSMNRRACDNVR